MEGFYFVEDISFDLSFRGLILAALQKIGGKYGNIAIFVHSILSGNTLSKFL